MKFYRRVFESFLDREVGILTVLHVSLADVAAGVSEVNYTSADCPFQPSVSGFSLRWREHSSCSPLRSSLEPAWSHSLKGPELLLIYCRNLVYSAALKPDNAAEAATLNRHSSSR